MSLFGQPQQQPAANIFGGGATGGLFGASNTPTQPATTTNPGGSLFGNTNTQGTGLFGQQQQQQPAAQPTSSIFGNTTQNQPAGGSLFGNPQQQQAPQTQPAASGLFGSNTGGNLFGPKPAGGPALPALNTNLTGGSSLFGTSALGAQPTQPASIFGQPAQNQNQQQQQQQQQRPGLFGTSTGSTTNIFGNSTAANNNNGAPKPALFGTSQVGFGIGGQQQQQQPQNPLAASTLTASTLRPPGAGLSGATQSQPDAQTQFTRLTARIEGIAAAWNSASPQCQFQYIFYNRVDPNQVNLYGRPPNATNDALWAKAVRENPDPTCLVPTIATGFDDLRSRVDAQSSQASAHQERLKDLKTRISTLSSTQQQNSARLARLAATQTQLTHRLLALAAHLHLLVPAVRGSGIRVEEEELRGWLEEVREEVGGRGGAGWGGGNGGGGGGGGGGRMRGKLGELWALVGALGAAKEAAQAGTGGHGGEWKVVDEEGLARIARILAEQQAGLVHLMKTLKADRADIDVVLKGSGKKGEEGMGDGEGEMWGSRGAR
ncbi:adrenoleukodystrophy protein, partial [Favolaschia claudopus]